MRGGVANARTHTRKLAPPRTWCTGLNGTVGHSPAISLKKYHLRGRSGGRESERASERVRLRQCTCVRAPVVRDEEDGVPGVGVHQRQRLGDGALAARVGLAREGVSWWERVDARAGAKARERGSTRSVRVCTTQHASCVNHARAQSGGAARTLALAPPPPPRTTFLKKKSPTILVWSTNSMPGS